MLKAIQDFLSLFGWLKMITSWLIAEENKQIGRNEAAYDVTRKTAETENAMRVVPDSSERDVIDSLQSKKF